MINVLASIIVAAWVSAIALLSVQNARPVSLRFLTMETVRIPIGLLLAGSASVGMVAASLVLPFISAAADDDDPVDADT